MMKYIVFYTTWVLGVSSPCAGLELDELEKALSGPVVVTINEQLTFRGFLVRVSQHELVLHEQVGQGSVEYVLDCAKLQRIHFPGNHYVVEAQTALENEDYTTALTIMDALFKQRAQLLRWQSPAIKFFFIKHAETHLNYGSLTRAIQLARHLQGYLGDAGHNDAIDDILLNAYHRLGFEDQTHILSKKWIKDRPANGQSALGWFVRADLMLAAEDYHQALHIALEPIVFSSQFPMVYLDRCYAVAITAAVELHEAEYAQLLWTEMQARGFEWPQSLTNPM